uniref:SPFH/Band 7/PHB domain protein n=1 Tax=Gongylonema pulchrum TaxID=637853 RepID=A0A183EFU7_9BILA
LSNPKVMKLFSKIGSAAGGFGMGTGNAQGGSGEQQQQQKADGGGATTTDMPPPPKKAPEPDLD